MITKNMGRVLVVVAGLGVMGVGCSKSNEEAQGPSQVQAPPPAAPEAPAAAPAAPGGPGAPAGGPAAGAEQGAPAAPPADADKGTTNPDGSVALEIESVGDTIAYNKKAFVVPAGKKVTLTLKNNATTEAMKHNWILVKKGKVDDVGIAGLQAGEAKNYIPDSPDIIAHTDLAGPGKTVTVTFDAPPAGEYEFLCSFPGHYTIMRGTLFVTQ